jgi:alkyl hydroperoxide reductase subunit AhpC
MVDAHLDFRVAYTRVVVISTDDQLGINEFRDSVGAQFPFLADPQRTVQKDFDIVEYTDPVHDPMIPHTFVLAPALKISVIYNGYWYLGRPTVASPYRHSDKRANYLHSGQNINAEWAGEVCCGSSRDSPTE